MQKNAVTYHGYPKAGQENIVEGFEIAAETLLLTPKKGEMEIENRKSEIGNK